MNKYHLDIIIPVYNEGKKINYLIKKLNKNINCKFRILICYDFKEDTTIKEIKNKKNKNIILVKNPGEGPNKAIKQGIRYSKSNIILVFMADDFQNIRLINQMIKKINKGYDLIIPSRFIVGGKFIGGNFFKKLVTRTGSFLLHRIAGLPYRDCTNAFKMFNKKIKSKIKLNSSKGFTFALELTIKAHFQGFKIIEIPSIWRDSKNRKSNFKVLNWLPYYFYWFLYSLALNVLSRVKI